jgi:hypothetical protein
LTDTVPAFCLMWTSADYFHDRVAGSDGVSGLPEGGKNERNGGERSQISNEELNWAVVMGLAVVRKRAGQMACKE